LLVSCGAALLFGRNAGKDEITLIRRGRFSRSDFALILVIALVSAAALIAWVDLLHPDLSGFVSLLPNWPTVLLVVLGIVFAILNGRTRGTSLARFSSELTCFQS
jgi:hypothetical protein